LGRSSSGGSRRARNVGHRCEQRLGLLSLQEAGEDLEPASMAQRARLRAPEQCVKHEALEAC
jgi:hypothetical protein